jgi:biopolymer transport protein ExbD
MPRHKSSDEVELNLAAMLDMAFQLLSFFMLTFRPPVGESQFGLFLPPPQVVADPDANKDLGSTPLKGGRPRGVETVGIKLESLYAEDNDKDRNQLKDNIMEAMGFPPGRINDEARIAREALTGHLGWLGIVWVKRSGTTEVAMQVDAPPVKTVFKNLDFEVVKKETRKRLQEEMEGKGQRVRDEDVIKQAVHVFMDAYDQQYALDLATKLDKFFQNENLKCKQVIIEADSLVNYQGLMKVVDVASRVELPEAVCKQLNVPNKSRLTKFSFVELPRGYRFREVKELMMKAQKRGA